MAVIRDRYILELDTRSATTALNQLKTNLNGLGSGSAARGVDQLNQKLNGLGRAVDGVDINNLNRDVGRLRTTMAAAAGAAAGFIAALGISAISNFAAGARDAYVEMERLQTSLTVFLGSARLASAELDRIGDLANEFGVRVQDLAGAFTIFTRFGLDTSSKSLKAWTNVALASGKSLDQLGEAVADALTGEFERFKEFGIKISNESGRFTARIGEDVVAISTSTTDLITQLQRLGEEGGRFGGAITENANTLGGSMARLSNAANTAQVAFMEGLKPALIEVNNELAKFLESNERLFEELGSGLGEALRVIAANMDLIVAAVETLRNVLLLLAASAGLQFMIEAARQLAALFGGLRSKLDDTGRAFVRLSDRGEALRRLGPPVTGLGAIFARLTTPIGLVVTAITGIEFALQALTGRGLFERLAEQAEGAMSRIKRAIDDTFNTEGALVNVDASTIFEQAKQGLLSYEAAIEELKTKLRDAPGLMLPFMGGQGPLGLGFVFEEDQQYVDNLRAMIAELETLRSAAAAAGEAIDSVTPEGGDGRITITPEENPDPTSFVAYFNTIMESARATVRETQYLQWSIEDLELAISSGTGTAEEIAAWTAALAALKEQAGILPSVTEVLTQLGNEFQRQADTANLHSAVIAELNNQYNSGQISVDYYRAAVESLGASFEEQMRIQGNVSAYIEDIIAATEDSIAADDFKQRSLAALNAAYAAGEISLQQYGLAVEQLGSTVRDQAIAMQDLSGYINSLLEEANKGIAVDAFKGTAIAELDKMLAAGTITLQQYERAVQSAGGTVRRETTNIANDFQRLRESNQDWIQSLNRDVNDAQVELELMNMDPLEQQVYRIGRGIQLELQDRIAQLREIQNSSNYTEIENQIAEITRAASGAIKEQEELARRSYEQQRSFATGWRRAFQEYKEAATDAAQTGYRLFQTMTSGLEDLIVGFAKTGKFEWKEFVASMAEEILRANVRQLISGVMGTPFGQSIGNLLGMTVGAAPGSVSGQNLGTNPGTPMFVYDIASAGLPNAIGGALGGVNANMNAGFANLGGGITSLFNSAFGGFGTMFNNLFGAIGGLGSAMMSGFQGLAVGIGNALSSLVGGLGNMFGGGGGGLLGTVVNGIGSAFSGIFGGIGSAVSGLVSGIGSLFGGFFATGGMIPPGRFGIVGENGPELVNGPATVTPMDRMTQQVIYNINAVDALSFRQLLARDPAFIHAVAMQGARTMPARG